MKVYIGKPKHFWGIFQLVDLLQAFGVHGDTTFKWAEKIDDKFPKINKFFNWIYQKRQSKPKIKIHYYDVWSMDYTLSPIILAMMLEFKRQGINGAPCTDDEDVPENLRSVNYPAKENDWDTDDGWHPRWEWIVDEIIWTFTQLSDENNDAQFHSGEDVRFNFGPPDENGNREWLPNPKHKYDAEGHQKHRERIQNGLRLFGKYYQALWN